MSELAQKTCTPCQGGVPRLDAPEAERLLAEVPGWRLDCNHTKIRRRFEFPDFTTAFAFAKEIHDLAEAEWHHPDLEVAWGRVEVTFYTHKIKGLHENDFIIAAKVNEIAS